MTDSYVTSLNEFAGGAYRQVIADAITNQPRSLQQRIGPSEIGTTCDPCLVAKLAGASPPPEHLPWLPQVGIAVHAWLEHAFSQAGEPGEWLTEQEVAVGQVGGVDITGHADLYHLPSGTIIDWKVVGESTLKEVEKHGTDKPGYRVQKYLYAAGFRRLGLPVTRCVVAYLPRNHIFLDRAVLVVDQYDREAQRMADEAMARANVWHALIRQLGPDAALEAAGEHTGTEFSCKDFLAAQKRERGIDVSDLLAS